MNLSSRRLSRTGLAAVACLSMSLSLVAPAVAGADENAKLGIEHVSSTTSYPESTPALSWGVLSLFRQVSGGFDRVFDGAALHSGVPSFAFVSRTNEDDGSVSLKYAGTANVMSFCGPTYLGADERGACKLDLTVSEPIVTLNPADGTGTLSLVVHSLDKKTKEWVGPSRVVMANLDLTNAKYRSGDVSTVRDIAVTVTAEGRSALSGNPKGSDGLDALNLSFTGPVTFGASSGATEELTLEKEVTTDFTRGESNRLFGLSDGSVLHVTRGGFRGATQLVIADNDLGTFVTSDDVTINRGNPSAFKSATDTLYWADGDTVRYATVSSAGVGAIMDLGTLPNANVSGLAYSEVTDSIGVLTADLDTRKGVLTEFKLSDMSTTATELPPMSEVRGTAPSEDGGDFDSTYGYKGAAGEAVGLRALPDGTFVYILDDILEGPDGRTGSTPLHIRPGQTPAAVEIAAAKDQFKSVLFSGGRRTVSVVDDNIVFYNGVNNGVESVGVYTYSDGAFTKKSTADKVEAFDFITGATFDADGNLVMASAGEAGELAVLDPTTLEVISSTTVGGTLQYTNGKAAETLKIIGDDIFITGVEGYGTDDKLTFVKVGTGGAGTTVGSEDDSLTTVELGTSDANEPLKGSDTPGGPAGSGSDLSSGVKGKIDGLSGKAALGSGGLSLMTLFTAGGVIALIAALFHFIKTQFPGGFQLPTMPGMER
ncbi:HtaA domain-containing protein [Corynebacterium pygosceleis]|uniref:HtaA domain-containing protein n=1 Tax=Corynebacterium pygosceleis TaxID=2800406 RepID=UPI0019046B9E|nr:HtaA domain-containing protein [Corynebacterium pygosceleis]MCL0120434.1 HtaA domain-containing protein [Corynebacterium pygosceleis]